MIIAYMNHSATLEAKEISTENQTLLRDAVWIDLLSPTREEESLVEQYVNEDIPTREEVAEIELSSRLYRERDTLFMTATMIAQSDSPDSKFEPVTFVLKHQQLITIRYIDPQAFKLFILSLRKLDPEHRNPVDLCIGLIDATVDRLADILEHVGHNLDDCSKIIFQPQDDHNHINYQQELRLIGANGNLNTKARESLLTFNRLVSFMSQSVDLKMNTDSQFRLSILSKDIASLSDHSNFLSTKVNFLLDAILGMVSIEQNDIIKIFSVAAVIFLPPTLIASIYGMNFQHMPELSWKGGYALAISLMILAAWLPYKYFKYRKWL